MKEILNLNVVTPDYKNRAIKTRLKMIEILFSQDF
jgi:hypothetical protein